MDYMTESMVASFYQVGNGCIMEYGNKYAEELSRYGYKVLRDKELKELKGKLGTMTNLRVASKYPHIAMKYFQDDKGQTIEIIKLNGSVELAPLVGLSDVIVDIVETGKTLYENGLDVLEDVCPLSARFVVNKVSMKMETERIMNIVKQFEERIAK